MPNPDTLLHWYDAHARDLPWRIGPAARRAGHRPDPYRVWLSEVMLQQTTVATVRRYFARFTALWPEVAALAAAPREDVLREWAGLGYYARARNLHACAQAVVGRGGFPETEEGLRTLPGIGAYTAAAIAAIAFDRPAVVVDGNVERVVSRLFSIETPLPAAKPEIRAGAARLTPERRPGCFAQAMMDLGATVCTPRNPACGICPWVNDCEGRRKGLAPTLPRKAPKAARPVRRGVAFVALREDGAVLVEQRPDKGLLGGMLGLPGTDWRETGPVAADDAAPAEAAWQAAEGVARHVFTHFQLELSVRTARVRMGWNPAAGQFMPVAEARRAMPTALRKALDVGLAALHHDEVDGAD